MRTRVRSYIHCFHERHRSMTGKNRVGPVKIMEISLKTKN